MGNYSAAFVSETWTKAELEHTNKYRIPYYHEFLKSRDDCYGGCALFLKQDLGYSVIDLPSLSEATQAVAIKVCSLDLVLVSIYIAPSITVQDLDDDLSKIFNTIKHYKQIIIGGDFNAHHYAWGNEFHDRKGVAVMNMINDNNVILINDNSKTFIPIQMNRKSTAIDLTLCSPSILSNLAWETLDYGIGSHHVLIKITYSTTISTQQKWVYNYKK